MFKEIKDHRYSAKGPDYQESALAYYVVKECEQKIMWDTAKIIANPSNKKNKKIYSSKLLIYEKTLTNSAIKRTEDTEKIHKYWKEYLKWKHKSHEETTQKYLHETEQQGLSL